jgi:hypothetical protein
MVAVPGVRASSQSASSSCAPLTGGGTTQQALVSKESSRAELSLGRVKRGTERREGGCCGLDVLRRAAGKAGGVRRERFDEVALDDDRELVQTSRHRRRMAEACEVVKEACLRDMRFIAFSPLAWLSRRL